MCNSIIERHDGIMVASSSPGLGSAFNVYLPASPDNAPAEPDAASDGPTARGRALVMDDDRGVQQVACEMLTHIGFSVTTVANGTAAVEAYSSARTSGEPYDFVLVDLTIPGGKGGLETLRELLEVDPDVRAIVSSGYFSDPAMFDFGSYGFCGILPKPYSLSDLRRLLGSLL
jgi:CheY-like chemotaxis protein